MIAASGRASGNLTIRSSSRVQTDQCVDPPPTPSDGHENHPRSISERPKTIHSWCLSELRVRVFITLACRTSHSSATSSFSHIIHICLGREGEGVIYFLPLRMQNLMGSSVRVAEFSGNILYRTYQHISRSGLPMGVVSPQAARCSPKTSAVSIVGFWCPALPNSGRRQ